MRFLQILNIVILAATVVMGVVMAVVCLLLVLNRELAVEAGARLAPAAASALVFAIAAAAAALAVWAVARRSAWGWAAEVGMLAGIVLVVQFIRSL